jgi:hypothetical protein
MFSFSTYPALKIVLLTLILYPIDSNLFAQDKFDTMRIDGSKVNTKVLKPSSNRYLVYFKKGKDMPRTNVSFWTRNIEYAVYNGKDVIVVTQQWEDKDTITHVVKSICDRQSFSPIYQESWWNWNKGGSSTFDFVNMKALLNGKPLTDADTARNRRGPWRAFKKACDQFVFNWHLDLEVFPVLPFKEGKTFLIPFYDPGSQAPANVAYTVINSASLDGYNSQKIDCWLLSHESKGNKEIFWISKKTREVLKLEQEFSTKTGTTYRYKIKMGFSN